MDSLLPQAMGSPHFLCEPQGLAKWVPADRTNWRTEMNWKNWTRQFYPSFDQEQSSNIYYIHIITWFWCDDMCVGAVWCLTNTSSWPLFSRSGTKWTCPSSPSREAGENRGQPLAIWWDLFWCVSYKLHMYYSWYHIYIIYIYIRINNLYNVIYI